jgi:hypothetical protein
MGTEQWISAGKLLFSGIRVATRQRTEQKALDIPRPAPEFLQGRRLWPAWR